MENKTINTIRILAAEIIERAGCGHPGMPLGATPMMHTLWKNHLKHNPKNPSWDNRDRFVLSAGHASSMLYAFLHVFGYDVTMEDLKDFRVYESITPGHPEYNLTPGVENTSGPLGQGIAMGVGMAMAEERLSNEFNKKDFPIVDHYTYVLTGDGCIQEGVAQEACSLAGNLKLDKLILIYDKNDITIEGNIDITFSEDVAQRYEAYDWQVLEVQDGNEDLQSIDQAIRQAKDEKNKPSLVIVNTTIGYGCPPIADDCECHGNPLGDENIKILKETLGWEHEDSFVVPDEVYAEMGNKQKSYAEAEKQWNQLFVDYQESYPEDAQRYLEFFEGIPEETFDDEYWAFDTAVATRESSGLVLNKLAKTVNNFFGGSADLEPCNNTYLEGSTYFSNTDRSGPNIHFGIREFAMAAICNGIALHGGLIPYCGTFLVFADYLKAALRMSSIMNLPVVYILTHDSIGMGEDGVTHQPIEQLAMLRSQPESYTFRPADSKETAAAYQIALTTNKPTCLSLTRQQVPHYEQTGKGALRGAYILEDRTNAKVVLIGTGSEVELCLDAQKKLDARGVASRVVSMPCMELFEEQTDKYKESVLPSDMEAVVVEAASRFGWERYIGKNGQSVTIDHFGGSAPYEVLYKEFGFTAERVAEKAMLAINKD